ncbi:sugar phosphate isomerase/epimerase family protein [Actinoplanes subtropicus]|uniref:sugar phosphate isomerase/epimerase family protein n=1 Tax=Actinoplanes subtropicus TaxID=543632 RepID=UPI0004C418DA|nr:sugar phosphate isomerase/epimerase [Actinoplanes subtropicus]
MCIGCDTPTPVSRRGFLGAAAGVAGVAAAAGIGAGSPALAADGGRGRNRIPVDQISIQLYTLRDLLTADLDGTLAGLHGLGFTKVEHAGFAGRTAADFKRALDRHRLWSSSGHQAIPQPFDAAAWQRTLADARTIGQRYIVNPVGPIKGFQNGQILSATTGVEWAAFAADLNKAGALARKAGLRLGYHNHYFEFYPLTDTPLVGCDILLAETDPELVHFEIDLYWAWYAHRDPVQLIAANQHRIRQFHVKDMTWTATGGAFTDPGRGIIDFARIFAVVDHPEDHEYTIERDDAGAAALTTARVGHDFLRSIRF